MIFKFLARLFSTHPRAIPFEQRRVYTVRGGPTVPSAREVIEQLRAEAARCDSPDGLREYMGHRNGYVREAAVERACELASLELLPALGARLNDWVEPVRTRAQQGVLQLLEGLAPDRNFTAAARLLLVVQHLRQAGRADHSAFIAAFEDRFVAVMGQRIVDAISGRDPKVARACFVLARDHRMADAATLCIRALEGRDGGALALAALAAVHRLPDPEREALYRLVLRSPSGAVRSEALRGLLAAAVPDHLQLARAMLVDTNAWVRLVAANWLRRHGEDVAGLYASHLVAIDAREQTLRASLSGLAESGATASVDLVRRFVAHPYARVQVEAFLAWARLAPADRDEIARCALASDVPRVRRLVLVLVRKYGAYVPIETALARMREVGDVDLMLTFARRDPWVFLTTIATLAGDARLAGRLGSELRAWLVSPAKAYVAPTAEQRAALRQPGVEERLLALVGGHGSAAPILASELRRL